MNTEVWIQAILKTIRHISAELSTDMCGDKHRLDRTRRMTSHQGPPRCGDWRWTCLAGGQGRLELLPTSFAKKQQNYNFCVMGHWPPSGIPELIYFDHECLKFDYLCVIGREVSVMWLLQDLTKQYLDLSNCNLFPLRLVREYIIWSLNECSRKLWDNKCVKVRS